MVEEGEGGERKSAQTKFYDRSKFSRSKINSYWKFSGKKSLSLENKIGKAFMHMIDIMKGNA